jgi:hypothetical protein
VKPLTREGVPEAVSKALGGRPVRWASLGSSIGDYDGRDATLDIFDASPEEQLTLLRQLRPIRDDIDAAAGRAVVFVFHTPSETRRLYANLSAGRDVPAAGAEPAPVTGQSLEDVVPPDTTVISANELAAGGITLSDVGPASKVGRNRWTGSPSARKIDMRRAPP